MKVGKTLLDSERALNKKGIICCSFRVKLEALDWLSKQIESAHLKEFFASVKRSKFNAVLNEFNTNSE